VQRLTASVRPGTKRWVLSHAVHVPAWQKPEAQPESFEQRSPSFATHRPPRQVPDEQSKLLVHAAPVGQGTAMPVGEIQSASSDSPVEGSSLPSSVSVAQPVLSTKPRPSPKNIPHRVDCRFMCDLRHTYSNLRTALGPRDTSR